MKIENLYELGEKLISNKQPLNSLHQEIADQFYPERAEFTIQRSLGTDFAANLMTSYPVLCRRSLGNQFSTMLRPTARPWFHPKFKYESRDGLDTEVRQWLDWFELVQRRAMYDPMAKFTRATKEGDHDFAAFGQCAISVEFNDRANHLLFRSWHLRDMAWQEDESGDIGFIARKWKPTAQALYALFKDKVHPKVRDKAIGNEPFEEFECRHFVCKAEMYDEKPSAEHPRFSIFYDVTHKHIMEVRPIIGRYYVIPRWQTVSGSQYSYSPATVCALPDARLLQAMTYTILEAGEKATSPPVIATKDAIRSDVALYAGGITWVDQEYDERLGEALRPLTQDFRGFNFGVQMNQDTRAMLMQAFFLDKLTLPQRAPEMTAYEVGQRVQQYIRDALPIFEPMEMEYNSAICDEAFTLLLHRGAFLSPRMWPRKMRGVDIDFVFESPLHDAIEEMRGDQFQKAQALIGSAIALDPSMAFVPKTEVALRDALLGIGVPARWINTEAYVADQRAKQQAAAQAQQKLAAIEQASNAAKNIGQSGLADQTQDASSPMPA